MSGKMYKWYCPTCDTMYLDELSGADGSSVICISTELCAETETIFYGEASEEEVMRFFQEGPWELCVNSL